MLILGLVLGGCAESPYNGQIRVDKYPEKYEYRCLRGGECQYINSNYKYEKIIKDKYKHLSKEELEKKDKKSNDSIEIIFDTVIFGIPITTGIATAINTTINVGAGGTGVATGVGAGVLAGFGTYLLIPMVILMVAYSGYDNDKPYVSRCNGEGRFYWRHCYKVKEKPSEDEKPKKLE